MSDNGAREFPAVHQLGSLEVTLRLMQPADREAVLAMARELPAHDLLFMRRDITDEAVVDRWLAEITTGEVTTILAVNDERVLGYGTVHRSLVPWTDHIGELRVLVAESARGHGLGRLLTHEAFLLALTLGVEKMIAQMTVDQEGAIATFSNLGFRPEAILRDQVKDRNGTTHDLIMMGHEVRQFQARRQALGFQDAIAGAASD